jgi:AcrR family transcriptional regulator
MSTARFCDLAPPDRARRGADDDAGPGTPIPAAPAIRRPGRPRSEAVDRAIARAALFELRRLGYARLSMESVAGEAGVARATVYRRYRDKADLVTAAIATELDRELDLAAPDPRTELVRFLEVFDDHSAECFEVLGSLLAARESPDAMRLHRERVIAPRTAAARRLLELAQARGELAADADLDLALQMLAGSVLARHMSGTSSSPGWAQRAVDTVWAGMGPRC